jgi:hypothetical protein
MSRPAKDKHPTSVASSKELLARENATLRLYISELDAGAARGKGIIQELRQRIQELETKPGSSQPFSSVFWLHFVCAVYLFFFFIVLHPSGNSARRETMA